MHPDHAGLSAVGLVHVARHFLLRHIDLALISSHSPMAALRRAPPLHARVHFVALLTRKVLDKSLIATAERHWNKRCPGPMKFPSKRAPEKNCYLSFQKYYSHCTAHFEVQKRLQNDRMDNIEELSGTARPLSVLYVHRESWLHSPSRFSRHRFLPAREEEVEPVSAELDRTCCFQGIVEVEPVSAEEAEPVSAESFGVGWQLR